MLRDLSRINTELSSDARRQILNAVTNLFLLDEQPSEAASAHYQGIALDALPKMSDTDRQSYAEQVATAPSLPQGVAFALANDEAADVAKLVLRLSPVLTDQDLAAIAVSRSQSHLLAIAERAQLSTSVTDILVARGDREVLVTVSGNEGAAFSDKGFDTLLQRGGNDAAISQTLAKRSDLAPERAARVVAIVKQFADGQGASEGTDLARQARQQRLEVKVLLADLAAGRRQLDDVVVLLADEDRAYHLAQVIGTRAEINVDHALRVLMQRDVSGVGVLCRSLDISAPGFSAILELRARRLFLAEHKTEEHLRDYKQLDAATADRAMRFLKLKTKVA
jgi:uncharacterized protein (DUF2336 family)